MTCIWFCLYCLLLFVCVSTGVVQGMITGIRGLCNGLGPALYGFVFYLFHVELNDIDAAGGAEKGTKPNMANPTDEVSHTFSLSLLFTPYPMPSLFPCLTLHLSVCAECHHSWSSLPIWSVLSSSLPVGGALHP